MVCVKELSWLVLCLPPWLRETEAQRGGALGQHPSAEAPARAHTPGGPWLLELSHVTGWGLSVPRLCPEVGVEMPSPGFRSPWADTRAPGLTCICGDL